MPQEQLDSIKEEKIKPFTRLWYLILSTFFSKKGLIFLVGTGFTIMGFLDGWEWLILASLALVGLATDNHATGKKSDWVLINDLKTLQYIKIKIQQMFEFGPFALVAVATGMFGTGNINSEAWLSAAGMYIGINMFDAIRNKFDGFSEAYKLVNDIRREEKPNNQNQDQTQYL